MKHWEVLAVSERTGGFFMEMTDGDSYKLEPVTAGEAEYLRGALADGRHIYATELW